MGHSWSIEGSVSHGDKRGRTIGFRPQIWNWAIICNRPFGVYAVRAEILSGALQGQIHDGVANLGLRPTVGGTAPRLETHLFDFDGDLYDQELGVALLDFIRPEQKFDGLDALKAQIARDSQAHATRWPRNLIKQRPNRGNARAILALFMPCLHW